MPPRFGKYLGLYRTCVFVLDMIGSTLRFQDVSGCAGMCATIPAWSHGSRNPASACSQRRRRSCPFCAFIRYARLARGPRMLQRPFLPPLPLRLPKPCARPKGEISAGGFGLSAFGFLFSRLLLCCLFATSNLPSVLEVTDAGAYSVDSPLLVAERRTKSSSTLAISIFLRGSCAVVVDAKRPSR